MSTVAVLLVAAAVTYALRCSMSLVGAERMRAVQAGVALVTPSAMAAMVASSLFIRHGATVAPPVAEIAALACALAVARRTGNISLALAAGLPVYWTTSAITVF